MRLRRAAVGLGLLLVLLPALALADAESDLDKAIGSRDVAGAKKALAAATSAGDAKAAATILKVALRMRDLDAHKELLDAIKGIKADDGVAKLAEQADKASSADLRYLLVEGLALQGSAAAQKAVLEALDDKEDAVQIVAARSTRHIPTVETIDKLIACLEKAEKNAKEASLCRELNGALAVITAENLSFALEWKGWWLTRKDSWKGGKPEAAADEGKSGGDTVMKRIAKERPNDAKTIERMANDDVVCVRGSSDTVQDVLKAIGIKHTVVPKDKFAETKLDPKSILIVNCDGNGHPAFDEAQLARIREFVDKGGYLFTSDWELVFTIEKAFPGSIAKGGESSKNSKDDYKVDIKPQDGKHPLLRDVFPLTTWDASQLSWKMDGKSFLIKLLSSDVSVLIESNELKKRFPETPAVAVTFWWKNGKVVKAPKPGGDAKSHTQAATGGCVLHVLSHFKHQKDKDSGDKFALQQLLLNFFLEKQAQNKLK
ncbi:MAG: HEAT repeat domain-containing protein [Planctomycetota bacterium]